MSKNNNIFSRSFLVSSITICVSVMAIFYILCLHQNYEQQHKTRTLLGFCYFVILLCFGFLTFNRRDNVKSPLKLTYTNQSKYETAIHNLCDGRFNEQFSADNISKLDNKNCMHILRG